MKHYIVVPTAAVLMDKRKKWAVSQLVKREGVEPSHVNCETCAIVMGQESIMLFNKEDRKFICELCAEK